MISDNNPALLVALRQLFPDQAREIWILVRCTGTLVDPATLLEFAERKAGGDEVTLVEQLVAFTIN